MRQDRIIEQGFQQIEEAHKYAIGLHDHEPIDIGDAEMPYTICRVCEKKLKEWYE